MVESGHDLRNLGGSFSAQLSGKLDELSIRTAEEFIGLVYSQGAAEAELDKTAQALGLSRQGLQCAIAEAKSVTSSAFLEKIEEAYCGHALGACIDDDFELPPDLSRHLRRE